MLLLVLILALQAGGATPEPNGAGDEAREAFARAEELVRAGRYADARSAYARVASKWAETPSGIEAARRSQPSAYLGWADVVRNGPSANRVDVVLMGDGYELEHLKAFDKLAADVPPLFERQETFREYYSYFNFLRAALLSKENGVDGFGRDYDTALGAFTAATFAGHVSVDGSKVGSALARIPDSDGQAIVFVKNGVLGTGGGGYAVIGGREVRTIIHEFGHSFGGLGDEYQSAQSHGQASGNVGERANVSGTDDPKAVPWSHWLAAKHPGVGVYEGAAGRVKGAWRPTSSGCVMDSSEAFCVPCREALVLRIYSIVDPIDACAPPAIRQGSSESIQVGEEGVTLSVDVLRPATHALEVSWWVLSEGQLPKSGAGAPGESRSTQDSAGTAGPKDRTKRGPLQALPGTAKQIARRNNTGSHSFRLTRTDLGPGRHRVVCRVRDTTIVKNDKWPWVLDDPLDLLTCERAWWLEVAPAK